MDNFKTVINLDIPKFRHSHDPKDKNDKGYKHLSRKKDPVIVKGIFVMMQNRIEDDIRVKRRNYR
jgi:hypothetical protein